MKIQWSNPYFGVSMALSMSGAPAPPPPPPTTGGTPAAKAANDGHYIYLKVAA